jgi:hypothetical protein
MTTSNPVPVTIKGERSTKIYIGSYRRPLARGKFGKKHLIVKEFDDGDVMTLCGTRYDNKGIYISQFDVYDEQDSCSYCRQFAVL